MNTKALVTLLIGDSIRDLWKRYMEKGWRRYAERHGYDIVLIDSFVDTSRRAVSRTPHWQKCLILQHPEVKRYRHAVWVDADICINPFAAPCIVSALGPESEKVGCVVANEGEAARAIYQRYGVENGPDRTTNTGVLVLQPERHADMMAQVYRDYTENAHSAKENVPLSFHLFARDLVQPVDHRFNTIWSQMIVERYPFLMNPANPHRPLLATYCSHIAWCDSYFLHFIYEELVNAALHAPYNTRMDIQYLYQEQVMRNGFSVGPPQK